jgi:hypothetical protein
MIKLSLITGFLLIILSSNSYSQFSWEFVGVFNDKDIYYDKNSVIRDVLTYALVIAKPQKPSKDELGKEYMYFTLKCVFYKNVYSEIKCSLSDRIYYYSDNTFRKFGGPKLELSLNYNRVISDLYNKIK